MEKEGIVMEVRSVIASGHSLSLSLPSEWCKDNGVSKGSKLSIYTDKSSLYIRLCNNGEQVKETVDEPDTPIEPVETVEPKKESPFSISDLIKQHLKDSGSEYR